MSIQKPPRPEPLDVTPSAIPDTLTNQDAWVCWRYEWDADREDWTKLPVDVNTGGIAKSTDGETWTSFEDAVSYHAKQTTDTDGIGFVLHDEATILGLDLDDCRDPETGDREAWADHVLEKVPTYAEVSPSGTGLRLLGLGFVPEGGNRADVEDEPGHIEMYDTGRYLTVTGHRIEDTPADVTQVHQAVKDVHGEYIASDAESAGSEDGPGGVNPTPKAGKTGSVPLSDADLIEKAKNAENGEKFRRLWNGDTAGYPSQSEADQALVNLLAFWTGGDRSRIDSLFRESGLYREKWDADRGDRTYGERTIRTALEGQTEFYDPDATENTSPERDAGENVTDGDKRTGTHDVTWSDVYERYQNAENSDGKNAARYDAAEVLLQNHYWRTFEEDDTLWWYDPNDGIYRQTGESQARQIVRDRLRDKYARNEVREVLSHLRAATTVTQDDMGGPAEKVAVANGVLDVSDRELSDHDPEYNFLSRLGTEYDPDADCPRFKQFLDEVVSDETAKKKLQEFAGFTLMHWRLKWHKSLFIVGPRNSGKSTFADTIRALHGEDTVASLSPQEMTQRFGGAELYGKWVNIRNDIPASAVKKTGTFKEIIAGDPIKAERKGKDPFMFTPTAKHIFAANQLPDTENDDGAFYRRILLAAFPRTIPQDDRDGDLDEKLESELPGILNWALDGLQRLREQGGFTGDLTPSLTAEKWDKWGSTVDRFASTCLDVGDVGNTEPIPKKTVHQVYKNFCEQESMPAEMQSEMTTRLKTDHNVSDGRATVNGTQKRCFLNVSFTARADAYRSDTDAGGRSSSGFGGFE
ncbi:phage/plasmid primase, P4 family [Halobacterium jilantaiense]|uniref:Phage/plasmid primase, P4 family, C-terminal domain-containing protein n=1 Tax=Halobacterium jilantaiense TaxID=355548 RepID=A0A1I0Q0N8_9EURY|nr:phage/plasmid primase, P4 family [Halobacterium jilantaiense]SEW20437.1 phage/plasmid primase, P4 family, C-terminal domain-containing protein [Halobacterium jilantaiense]